MSKEKKEVATIKKSELAEAVRDSFSLPECEVINTDVARDPKFQRKIQERLETVGNNAFGDISAELSSSSKVDDFSLSLIDSFFEQLERKER